MKKDGQILLITLIVLMILGIILVGVVVLVSRDTTQQVSSEKYEEAFNTAENRLTNMIFAAGDRKVNLSTLPSIFSECIPLVDSISYECEFANDSSFGNAELDSKVLVENSKDVEEFEIFNDRSLELDLSTNYRDGIDFEWDKEYAVQFTLIYYRNGVTTDIHVIKDIYDKIPIYSSTDINYDNFTDSLNKHPMSFSQIDILNDRTKVRLNIGAISGLNINDRVVSLRVTLKAGTNEFDSAKFTIKPTNYTNYPYQVRKFEVSTLDDSNLNTPIANIFTQIPLYPQIDSVFDKALITDGTIENN